MAFGCKLALANGRIDPPLPDTASVQHLASEAFTQAEAQPGFSRPQNVALKIKPGETFEAAVQRAGVTAQEAHEAVATLGEAMDTVHIKAGMPFDAAIAQPQGEHGPARLIGLSLRSGPASAITLSRTFDGALRLREMQEKVNDEQTVAKGEIDGSLYESAARLGATPTVTAQVAKMFAHKLDFQRDIQPGDKFTLIFDRKVTESGRTIQSGDVEYAQIKGVKFYRFERRDGDVEYFDENGKNVRGFLLRTPVDGARMTSTFGMRKHPILGYTRMHKGIDFGAGMGTPVVAAGDGVVVEARRWGTYGNWVRIRHTGGWDTGYAHLSRFAKGLHAGDRVRQGQVIAYVGSTGASTGPHLHYEIWKNGQRVNPIGAKVPQGTVLAGAELAKFRTVKAHIDHLVETKGDDQNGETALAMAETSDSVGLRR
ncbi:peptidoglycan DD-metalloendopeptidase family protein [Phenylobacterium sp.]|uniref:M23 family metallopeptidase n=1 Tax=Phenylobacterium sp. TaxID=1871053 RepID=UPI0035B1139C